MKKLFLSLLLMITLVTVSTAQGTLCAGTTKAGQPCKMKVTTEKYCRFHNPNAIKCSGIKKDGTSCKMQVAKQGDYCHYHQPK